MYFKIEAGKRVIHACSGEALDNWYSKQSKEIMLTTIHPIKQAEFHYWNQVLFYEKVWTATNVRIQSLEPGNDKYMEAKVKAFITDVNAKLEKLHSLYRFRDTFEVQDFLMEHPKFSFPSRAEWAERERRRQVEEADSLVDELRDKLAMQEDIEQLKKTIYPPKLPGKELFRDEPKPSDPLMSSIIVDMLWRLHNGLQIRETEAQKYMKIGTEALEIAFLCFKNITEREVDGVDKFSPKYLRLVESGSADIKRVFESLV